MTLMNRYKLAYINPIYLLMAFFVILGELSWNPEARSQTITYTYDQGSYGIGRLSSVTDPTGSTAFSYDQRGNILTKTKVIDSNSYTLQYTYDSLNRLRTLTYPDGEVLTYRYGPQGLLGGIVGTCLNPALACSGGTSTWQHEYILGSLGLYYNAMGRKTVKKLYQGVTTTYDYYDNTSKGLTSFRLRNIKTTKGTTTLQDLTYTYDPVGNVSGITDAVGSNTQTFQYDNLSRLYTASSPSSPAYNHTYLYDTIGNMTTGAGMTFAYPPPGSAHPHAPTSDGTSTYLYDSNGNMTKKTNSSSTHTFGWDLENHLISRDNPYYFGIAYDYAGTRVKKSVSGATTYYVDKVYECNPTSCVKYIFAGDELIASRQVGSNTFFLYLGDHLGSTSVVWDTTGLGSKLQDLSYYPYGQTRWNSLPSPGVHKKFTGQELDDETGLYNYGARYYDTSLMRFISADPVGSERRNPQTLNRYSYTLNNPLRYIDPTGNQDEEPCGIGCAVWQWFSDVFSWFGSQTTSQEVFGPPSPSFHDQIITITQDMKIRIFQSGQGETIPLLAHVGEQAVDLALAGDIRRISVADVSDDSKNSIAYYQSGRIYFVKENFEKWGLNIGQIESILSHEVGHSMSNFGPTILGEQWAYNVEALFESLVLKDPEMSYLGLVFNVPLAYPSTGAIIERYPNDPPGGIYVNGAFCAWVQGQPCH